MLRSIRQRDTMSRRGQSNDASRFSRLFARANDGVIAIKFAMMVPVLLLTVGIAIDASALTSSEK